MGIEIFDETILSLYHNLAVWGGSFFTPLAKFFTLIGEKGILFLLLSVGLMFFPKTRKIGVCLFGAVACGYLLSSLILKDLVARPRPFQEVGSQFESWWNYIGSPYEDEFSFPSGHATAAMAGVCALAFTWDKKAFWWGIPYVALMCASRNYLMAHYPTDVLAGIVVGFISALASYGVTVCIFHFLEKYKDNEICNIMLNKIDLGVLLKRIFKKEKKDNNK